MINTYVFHIQIYIQTKYYLFIFFNKNVDKQLAK